MTARTYAGPVSMGGGYVCGGTGTDAQDGPGPQRPQNARAQAERAERVRLYCAAREDGKTPAEAAKAAGFRSEATARDYERAWKAGQP